MAKNRRLRIIVAIAASFAGLGAAIVCLFEFGIIGPETAKLMLVALTGMYVGFGILIAVYRLIDKLE